MSEYIRLKHIESKPKTEVVAVINIRGDFSLGKIKWHNSWRQYCFFPAAGMVFSNDCLALIQKYIRRLTSIYEANKIRKRSGKEKIDLNKPPGWFESYYR